MALKVALVALLAALSASACADARPAIPREPAVFAVRDADSTIYLYGAVHVRPRGADWGGPIAHAALAASSDVWTEMEISPATDSRGQQLARQLSAAAADRPLSSWLTPAENARLAALCGRLRIDRGAMEHLQPWAASLTLTLLPIVRAGYDPQSGVDRDVDAYADAHRLREHAFETIDEQLGFLANLSPRLQRQMLLEAIDEAEQGPAELAELTGAWEHGDVGALQRIVVDEMRRDYPELYQVLFVRRNAAWLLVIQHELQGSGVAFIAVGAGHLLGPDGLVAQLRARGVRVDRVIAPPVAG
ncbi:MAG: TraB/GumN family protein [Proteobacteria bacterium]|nr:TraB/GumN family protein [Pseudomonadota bacterium]